MGLLDFLKEKKEGEREKSGDRVSKEKSTKKPIEKKEMAEKMEQEPEQIKSNKPVSPAQVSDIDNDAEKEYFDIELEKSLDSVFKPKDGKSRDIDEIKLKQELDRLFG